MSHIRRVGIVNFKSIAAAELRLAPLTLLIGPNGAGKSNVIEAVKLLGWMARGIPSYEIRDHLVAGEPWLRVGAMSDLSLDGQGPLLSCEVEGEDGQVVSYECGLSTRNDSLSLWYESIFDVTHEQWVAHHGDGVLLPGQVRVNPLRGRDEDGEIVALDTDRSIVPQLAPPSALPNAGLGNAKGFIAVLAETLRATLADIRVADPSPAAMREYARVDGRALRTDAANASAVLLELFESASEKSAFLEFLRGLTEPDINDITFLRGPRGEVMLQLVEPFGGGSRTIDAALLSDGTLRLVGIAASLFTAAPGSLVVIEELGHALYPARAHTVLDRLTDAIARRDVRVLATVHDSALLDVVPDAKLRDVHFCYRDRTDGLTRLTRLADIPDAAGLLAQGSLGDLVTRGLVDRFAKYPKSDEQKAKELEAFLARMREEPS